MRQIQFIMNLIIMINSMHQYRNQLKAAVIGDPLPSPVIVTIVATTNLVVGTVFGHFQIDSYTVLVFAARGVPSCWPLEKIKFKVHPHWL